MLLVVRSSAAVASVVIVVSCVLIVIFSSPPSINSGRFFLCEALCLVVVVGNIYFTDFFLDGTFMTYGTEVINFPDMDPENRVDPMTRIFPRVTKCTFR